MAFVCGCVVARAAATWHAKTVDRHAAFISFPKRLIFTCICAIIDATAMPRDWDELWFRQFSRVSQVAHLQSPRRIENVTMRARRIDPNLLPPIGQFATSVFFSTLGIYRFEFNGMIQLIFFIHVLCVKTRLFFFLAWKLLTRPFQQPNFLVLSEMSFQRCFDQNVVVNSGKKIDRQRRTDDVHSASRAKYSQSRKIFPFLTFQCNGAKRRNRKFSQAHFEMPNIRCKTIPSSSK